MTFKALTGARGLRLQQCQRDCDRATSAGQVQRGGAGAQPRAVAYVAAQHSRVHGRAALCETCRSVGQFTLKLQWQPNPCKISNHPGPRREW